MPEINVYSELSRADLKALLKTNKNNPTKLVLIEAALKDSTPYRAGRLRNTEMSDVAAALKAARDANPSEVLATKIDRALAVIEKFFGPEAPKASPDTPPANGQAPTA